MRETGTAAERAVRERRAALNAAMRATPGKMLVMDAAASRGLHIDAVSTVYILGLPANSEMYLHLCGRAGRLPRIGKAEVITVATQPELSTLRGWSTGLGGLRFDEL